MDIQVRSPGQRHPIGHDAEGVTAGALSISPTSPSSSPAIGGRGGRALTTVRLVSLAVATDHDLLLDYAADWASPVAGSALRYPKPEWTAADQVADVPGWPVSHTGGSTVTLVVTLGNDLPSGSRPVRGTLIGLPLTGPGFLKDGVTLRPGRVNAVRVESDGLLPEAVQVLSFEVAWYFLAPDCDAVLGDSRIPVFVTMGVPTTVVEFPGVTARRMAHAVERVGGAGSADPGAIIEHILKNWINAHSIYDPDRFRENAWEVGSRRPSDCDTISRYIKHLLLMIGVPGRIEPVRVWTRLKGAVGGRTVKTPSGRTKRLLDRVPRPSDFEVVETPITSGGLEDPALRHPTEPWELALIDHGGIPNDYEACIKLTPGNGGPRYYTPGTKLKLSHESTLGVIQHCFKTISWVEESDTSKVVGKVAGVEELK